MAGKRWCPQRLIRSLVPDIHPPVCLCTMLRTSLVSVLSAAANGTRFTLPRCPAARQAPFQVRTVSTVPRQQRRTQRQAGGRAYAGFAGHDASFQNATCKEVSGKLSSGSCKYLDVRTPEEYQAGHVPGATNVPVWLKAGGGMQPNPDFLKEVEALFMDKGVPLVVGCKSGRRSETACDLMTKAGFSGLTNLTGGFDAWLAEGLPVEK